MGGNRAGGEGVQGGGVEVSQNCQQMILFYFNYLKNCGRVHANLNPETEKKEEKEEED